MQKKPIFDPSKPSVTQIIVSECREILKSDFLSRLSKGIETYGTPLQPFNGRDALLDLYEEILDGCQYAKQLCIENPENIKYPRLYDSLISMAYYIKVLQQANEKD